jgi:rRNA-processing protein FCF1
MYDVADFELLERLLDEFATIATLPHILAEVNSLSSQLTGRVRDAFRVVFRKEISVLAEEHVPSTDAAGRSEFIYRGLTDAAILVASVRHYLVITDDLVLASDLLRTEFDVLNFTNLRSFN